MVLPAEYERGWGRGSSSALAGDSTRTQMVFANPFASGTVVRGIGLRPTAGTVDRASFTADVEVQISSSTAVPGALSSTYANNVGSDLVVALPRQVVTIPAMPANRSTGGFAQFLFPAPFVFGTNGGTSIVVDLFVYGRSAGASWSTDRAFAAASGRAANAGIGCGTATVTSTSTGGTYVAGATITVSFANGPASSLALLMPSFDLMEHAPGQMLPFDLSLVGAGPGCALPVNPGYGVVAYFTDPAGAASSSLTIPAGFGRFGTGWQWATLVTPSRSNPLGLETTANRAILDRARTRRAERPVRLGPVERQRDHRQLDDGLRARRAVPAVAAGRGPAGRSRAAHRERSRRTNADTSRAPSRSPGGARGRPRRRTAAVP